MNETCPTCHSPGRYAWSDEGRRALVSHVSRASVDDALEYLRTVDLGYGDDQPLLGEGVLERHLSGEDAARIRTAFTRLTDEAARGLEAQDQVCAVCGAPAEEVFNGSGESRGLLWRNPGGDGFKAALAEVCALQVKEVPTKVFGPGNPLFESGDENAPFLSEAFLYVLLGKDPARSVLSATRRLAEAMGEPLRR